MADVRLDGVANLARALAADLDAALQAASLALAAELEDRIAPYPPAPPRGGRRRWYERGYGWRTANGRGDKPISERMGAQWSITPYGGTGAALRNGATYSGRVQSATEQLPIFRRIGWKTDQTIVDQVDADGTADAIVTQAVTGALQSLEP